MNVDPSRSAPAIEADLGLPAAADTGNGIDDSPVALRRVFLKSANAYTAAGQFPCRKPESGVGPVPFHPDMAGAQKASSGRDMEAPFSQSHSKAEIIHHPGCHFNIAGGLNVPQKLYAALSCKNGQGPSVLLVETTLGAAAPRPVYSSVSFRLAPTAVSLHGKHGLLFPLRRV